MSALDFTPEVRILSSAREEAVTLHHDYVGTEHILLAIITEGEGSAVEVGRFEADLQVLRRRVGEMVEVGRAHAPAADDLPYSSRAKKALDLSMLEAHQLNHVCVGSEHLLPPRRGERHRRADTR